MEGVAAAPIALIRMRAVAVLAVMVMAIAAGACGRGPDPDPEAAVRPGEPASTKSVRAPMPAPAPPLVLAARRQIGVTLTYDPAYVRLAYPGGDVPQDRGVCTDVVIRALRSQGLDLQRSVHEDLRRNFSAYPQQWGQRGPDASIDHRRVPVMQRWFERQGWSQTVSDRPDDYRAGDLVTWKLDNGLAHIGIVSNRKTAGVPLIIHNIGAGTHEDDILFRYRITGLYRPVLPAQAAASQRQ